MAVRQFHLNVISGWSAALGLLFVVCIVLGLRVSPATTGLGTILWIVPSFMFVIVFRGAPSQTIAEVLRDAERGAGSTPSALFVRAKRDRRGDFRSPRD